MEHGSEMQIIAYPSSRNKPQQRIDRSLLIGDHHWSNLPDTNPSFAQHVEMNATPRLDMARYKSVSIKNSQHARDAWSKMCKFCTGSLFRIPDSIICDRTFARDSEEVYYLDAMHAWLNGLPEDLHIRDIPLVKRSLQKRLMYAFMRRPGYYEELFERRRIGAWLPFDAFENKYFGDVELLNIHPLIEAWLDLVVQPSALPVPVPFVVYYFYRELREAQRKRERGIALSERERRLLFCLEKEYYVLFMAMWWSEASYGSRQFVLTSGTVEVLERECSELPASIGIKPAQVILEYMRTASTRSSNVQLWLRFRNNWMEESTYVWSREGTGEHDPERRPVRITLWADKDMRRIKISEHAAKGYKRNTVLDKTVRNPDLDKIPGLSQLVYGQNWNLHGNMRVGDLLGNLVRLYDATRSVVNTLIAQGIPHPDAGYSRRDGRYFPNNRSSDRIGYPEARDYRYDRHYDDDWNRDGTYNPLSPRHCDNNHDYNRGGNVNSDGPYHTRNQPREDLHADIYRSTSCDVGGEARHDYAPVIRGPLPPGSPDYPPEQVYELPDHTPKSGHMGETAGGVFLSRNLQKPQQMQPVLALRREETVVHTPQPRKPGSCRDWLLGTRQQHLEAADDVNGGSDQTQDGGNPGGDNDVGRSILDAADYTKARTGNVSWGLEGRVGEKRSRADTAEERLEAGSHRNVRSKNSASAADTVE